MVHDQVDNADSDATLRFPQVNLGFILPGADQTCQSLAVVPSHAPRLVGAPLLGRTYPPRKRVECFTPPA